MRVIIGVICLLILVSCNSNKPLQVGEKSVVPTTYNFDWLLGDWKRTNDEPGNRTFESWNKESDQLYVGKGWTMKSKDTISQEIMHIELENQNWVLKVSLPGIYEVTFDNINTTKNSFEFGNDKNDFPKLIKYKFDGKNLNAEISGGGPTIPFEFEKIVLRN